MDKYNTTQDYYNYVNNYYNQPSFNQSELNKLYDPYNGFIRGNMFPQLYNGYKLSAPLDIQPMNEQAELLTSLDALMFSTIDLNLYLDLYPNDKQAIQLFNNYRMQANEYLKEYENKYGPLLVDSDASNNYPWAWDNSPWPWQKK